MADRSMKFTLDFLAKTAGLKNAAELAEALGEELDDSVDSGKKLAAAMRFSADRIESDLAQTREMADRLGNALGPEMAQKLGQSRLDEWAVKIRQAGVTADQLDENIDDITASIKRMDAAAESVDGFDQSMKKVGDTTDQTRSVVANFAGNAAQELPGITGAMGPLNMAIGQFAEYASEGNIKMKNLLAAGVGLGALAFVMSKFVDNSKNAAEIDAFNTERAEAYADALKEASSSAEAVRDVLTEAGRVEFKVPGFDLLADATPRLLELGLTADKTAKLIAGGEESIRAWEKALVDSGVPAESLVLVVGGLLEESRRLQRVQDAAAVTAEYLARTQDDVNRAVEDFIEKRDPIAEFPAEFERMAAALANDTAPALADVNTVAEGLNITTDEAIQLAADYADTLRDEEAAALDAARQAAEDAEQAHRDLNDARLASIDSSYALTAAEDRFTSALEAAAAAKDDAKTGVDEYRQAQDEAAQAALGVAAAEVRKAEDIAAANGQTLSAREANQLMIESLYAMVLSLDENSPVRAALEAHIATLQGVPSSATTNVTVTGTDDAATRIGGVKASADDLADQFDDLYAAAEESWVKTAEGAEDATEAQRDYQREINNTKQEVAEYLTEVLKLPPDKVTNILALIDQGRMNEAQLAIWALTQPKEIPLIPSVKPAKGIGNLRDPNTNAFSMSSGYTESVGRSSGASGTNLNVNVSVSGVITGTQVGQEIANALQAWWNDGGSASWAAAR